MGKKRVLVDIFYLHVAQTGIKTYIESLYDEIENQEAEGFEFILSPRRQAIKDSSFFKGKTAFWKNLLYQGIYFFRKLVVIPWLSIRHGVDIVFSPDILSPLWAKGKKVSVIHDAFFWENPAHYNPIWLKIYLPILTASLRKNAHVITVSKHSKKQIQKYLDLPKLSIDVVYPASNLTRKDTVAKKEARLKNPYFLHVGVMEKRKNLTMLVQAFAQLIAHPDFGHHQLVLVGQPGPRKELDAYEDILSLIQQHNLQEKVVLTGYVSQDELDSYYNHALGYVFPSLNEGFGMPILEAFSYGLPVVIANQETLAEVGGEAVLKVSENTAVDFEAAMRLIAMDESLRKDLVELGYRRLSEFSAADFFLSLQSCFRKILNE